MTVTEPRVDRLLTLYEVAKLFGVSPRTVSRYAELGMLTPIRLVEHGRFRFRERDVQALIDASERPKGKT